MGKLRSKHRLGLGSSCLWPGLLGLGLALVSLPAAAQNIIWQGTGNGQAGQMVSPVNPLWVQGSVTATAGTNLNTSALAIDSRLASLMTSIGAVSGGCVGTGGAGPYAGMTASTASPKILAAMQYTGTKVLRVRSLFIQPVTFTAYTTAAARTIGVRKLGWVSGQTLDTGGTNLSAYFGVPTDSASGGCNNVTMIVAGTPGTPTATGLTAGTMTATNLALQQTFWASAATAGLVQEFALLQPIVLRPNEGARFELDLAASADATGSLAFTIIIVWDEEAS